MRGISLWQPWASLMANGSKRDETRNSVTKVRGEVAICASLKWTRQLKDIATTEPFLSALITPSHSGTYTAMVDVNNMIAATPLGCVVAVGELYDSITSDEWVRKYWLPSVGFDYATEGKTRFEYDFGNYAPGRGVWRFRNMRKLKQPVPCKGAQQWFFLPDSVEQDVRTQL